MRTDELAAGKALDAWIRVIQTSKAVADAALAWWEDHGRQDCHFCAPQDVRTFVAATMSEEVRFKHDDGCPLVPYIEALESEDHG